MEFAEMTNTSRRTFLSLAGATAVGVGLLGCSMVGGGSTAESSTKVSRPLNGARTLVTYFSMPETDDPNNMTAEEEYSTVVIDGKVLGNTQYVAQIIAAQVGAKLFRIETAENLPRDHSELQKIADTQQVENARPKLKTTPPSFDDYDTVFIGYPIWAYDMPMVLYTFIEQGDFRGKNIVLFCTHGASEFSGTIERVTEALPDSTVVSNGLAVLRDDVDNSEGAVADWIASLN
ncbi:flavodoxin [Streptomyces chartreusis]